MTEEIQAEHTLTEHQHGGPDCTPRKLSSTATTWITFITATATPNTKATTTNTTTLPSALPPSTSTADRTAPTKPSSTVTTWISSMTVISKPNTKATTTNTDFPR